MSEPLILIIEDDSMMADTLASMVDLIGFQSVIFDTSAEALEAMLHVQPDLVLLDVNLPDISGFEVCRQIKTSATLKNTPVIIVSGESTDQALQQGQAAGADHYLVKPVGLDEMEVTIKQVLLAHSK
jgi:DNA-binding response OmpR family regulator